MEPAHVFLFVFVLTFGGALGGMMVQPLLLDHHLSSESLSMLKAARAVIVGLAALTLGMLLSSAKTSFEAKGQELKTQATKVITLGLVLNDFGPAAQNARAALRKAIETEAEMIDYVANHDVNPENAFGQHILSGLRAQILALKPENENQGWLKSTALSLEQQVLESRWRLYLELSSNFQRPLGGLLIFWLFCIFLSFGLIAPKNILVLTGLAMAAMSMSGAIFYVLELDSPYQGFVTISTQPLKLAVEHLGRN